MHIATVLKRKTFCSNKSWLFSHWSALATWTEEQIKRADETDRERDKELSAWDDVMKIYIAINELSWLQINNVNQRKKKQGRDKEVGPNSCCSTETMIKSQFLKKVENRFKQRRYWITRRVLIKYMAIWFVRKIC